MTSFPQMPAPPTQSDNEEVTADVVQLMVAATFNGLCHVMAAVARRHAFSVGEIEALHDAMVAPLDDPEHGDDAVLTSARDTVDRVLGEALARRRVNVPSRWSRSRR
jgi:hypothetical protein